MAIDRKRENGCEIQNAACARSGILLNLRLVTTAEHRRATHVDESEDLPDGTYILMELVGPWARTKRIVCADSYFAIVPTAKKLLAMGLRFIGVVKTATRGYPMGVLSVVPLEERGQHASLAHVTADGVTDIMAVLWATERGGTSLLLPRAACLARRASTCNGARWRPRASGWTSPCSSRKWPSCTTKAAPQLTGTIGAGKMILRSSTSMAPMTGQGG